MRIGQGLLRQECGQVCYFVRGRQQSAGCFEAIHLGGLHCITNCIEDVLATVSICVIDIQWSIARRVSSLTIDLPSPITHSSIARSYFFTDCHCATASRDKPILIRHHGHDLTPKSTAVSESATNQPLEKRPMEVQLPEVGDTSSLEIRDNLNLSTGNKS